LLVNVSQFLHRKKLSLLAGEFYLCHECNIVDENGMRVHGALCGTCGKPDTSGSTYFHTGILMLVDLLQEAYLAIPALKPEDDSANRDAILAHTSAVIVFFCTLKETLLYNFLREFAVAQKIPIPIVERLFADNSMFSQRIYKLFPSLVGQSWNDVMSNLTVKHSTDFVALSAFFKSVTDIRNDFVHKGFIFEIKPKIATSCLENLFPSLNLFVDLHNEYVYPSYQSVSKYDRKPTDA
jgi:hypothetical protein